MFWLYGSGVSIFTIMFSIHFITAPIKAIGSIREIFQPYEHKEVSLLLPKLAFFAIQIGLLGVALYRFAMMGVIPTTPVDWSGIVARRVPIEHSQVFT